MLGAWTGKQVPGHLSPGRRPLMQSSFISGLQQGPQACQCSVAAPQSKCSAASNIGVHLPHMFCPFARICRAAGVHGPPTFSSCSAAAHLLHRAADAELLRFRCVGAAQALPPAAHAALLHLGVHGLPLAVPEQSSQAAVGSEHDLRRA